MKALLTGVTGQDGSYMADILLSKGYEVYGMHRRTSTNSFERIKHNLNNPHFHLVCGEMTDKASLEAIVKDIKPDECYNFAAQSHVGHSFNQPKYTLEVNYEGLLKLSSVFFGVNPDGKLYQAGSSEQYGNNFEQAPLKEDTPFAPVSPYGDSKLLAYKHINCLARNGFYAVAGVLFNHESKRRGEEFVSRKITIGASKIKLGLQDKLELGNLNAKRDWGYAPDYMEAVFLMMHQPKPKNYVIGTGINHTVKEFVEEAFYTLQMPIKWEGEGINEKGFYNGKEVVCVNPKFYRPNELNILLADPSFAEKELGWKPIIKFNDLVNIMVNHDYIDIKEKMVK